VGWESGAVAAVGGTEVAGELHVLIRENGSGWWNLVCNFGRWRVKCWTSLGVRCTSCDFMAYSLTQISPSSGSEPVDGKEDNPGPWLSRTE